MNLHAQIQQQHASPQLIQKFESALEHYLRLSANKSPQALFFALRYYDSKAKELQLSNLNSLQTVRCLKRALELATQCLIMVQEMEHEDWCDLTDAQYIQLKEMCIVLLMKPELEDEHGNNLKRAKKLAQELLHDTQDSDRSLFLMGSIDYRQMQFANALQWYERAIEKNSKQPLYQQEYRQILFQLESYKKQLAIAAPDTIPKALLVDNAEHVWNTFCSKHKIDPSIPQLKQQTQIGNMLKAP